MDFILKEACVETLEEAINAEADGANRIELCSALEVDGLTPDYALTKQILKNISIPVKVMIRPRAGNFIYDEWELNKMKAEIHLFKELKIRGVVFGILDNENHLKLEEIEMLAQMASPLEVTIHKAIDLCPDPVYETGRLLKLQNITSILTSGKAKTAMEGKETIKEMMKISDGSIKIIAAGKVTNLNLMSVHYAIGTEEYHGRRIVGNINQY